MAEVSLPPARFLGNEWRLTPCSPAVNESWIALGQRAERVNAPFKLMKFHMDGA